MIEIDSFFDGKVNNGTAVTVGKFDGIHKGHSYLYSLLNEKKPDLSSLVVTFTNSPRKTFHPEESGSLITNAERHFMMEEEGIDILVDAPFDESMMNTSAEDFIGILVNDYNMKYMVAGSDFRFGKNGQGDAKLLEKLSKELCFDLQIVEKIQSNNRDISSTYVREELSKGNIHTVNELLGYEYFVWGEVVHGKHLGTKIGIPTINLIPPAEKLLPANGVYVTKAIVGTKEYPSVTNVGVKPSVKSDGKIGIETHILEFDRNLYGEKVKVVFLKNLRKEMKFSSVEELKNQMNKDKNDAKLYFS